MRAVLFRRCHRLLSRNYNRPSIYSIRVIRPVPQRSGSSAINHGITTRILSSWSHISPAIQQDDQFVLSEDTIFALSSAPGRAAIAIIRVSGPACVEIYHALCPDKSLPKPRYAAVRTLSDPLQSDSKDAVLDSNALVLYFPSPKTVTGEDILELHVHGGPATVKVVLQAIPKCARPTSTIRYAEAGEFTRRAFMNDRMDLTQVEALGDTLAATTEQQRKLSVRGTTGQLAKQYEAWRTQLLYARGELEALIDFSEDQHFDESPAVLASSVARQVKELEKRISAHITNAVRGELLRNGISIALLGAPNAGKSSLLNCIVGREAAIVSREAGTTRDVVEVGIDLGGYLCRVGDMAGLRTNQLDGGTTNLIGIVEEEGIKRAKQRALESDVVIVVFHIEQISPSETKLVMDDEVLQTALKCLDQGSQVLVVVNKNDLLNESALQTIQDFIRETVQQDMPSIEPESVFFISCKEQSSTLSTSKDANGIQTFLQGLTATFAKMTSAISPTRDSTDASVWQESLGASERHRLLLQDCLVHLQRFLAEVPSAELKVGGVGSGDGQFDVVVAAESLRATAECLARITGRGVAGDVEEVLGVVFEKFCVGK